MRIHAARPRRARRFMLVLVLTAAACGAPAKPASDPDALDLLGTIPVAPLPKVSFTLEDTQGQPYDFRGRTDGHLTLLYFGYTYCPDVCPLQMSTLAAALPSLDPAVRKDVRVVFVSVDPQRDTPQRLHEWLTSFDSSFVGLRGTPEQVAKILDFYRFDPPKQSGEEEGYSVSHPAYVYAFAPDDMGRGMYGSETTRGVWVHDLDLIGKHDWSHAKAAAAAKGAGGTTADAGDTTSAQSARPLATAGDVQILDAYLPRPASGDVTAVYVTLRNDGARADTLLGISSSIATRGSLHDSKMVDGQMSMTPLSGGLILPPGETVALKPGGRHGMLEGLSKTLEPGTTELVILRLARGGPIAVPARVVRYEDLVH